MGKGNEGIARIAQIVVPGMPHGDETIRRNTHTGRPLGTEGFLSKMEYLLGRRVRPLPVGRQKGWRKNKAATDIRTEG